MPKHKRAKLKKRKLFIPRSSYQFSVHGGGQFDDLVFHYNPEFEPEVATHELTPSPPTTPPPQHKGSNKTAAITGGVIGGTLAVAGAVYYGMKAFEGGVDDDLYYEEEPHIPVPATDPDPVANALNSAITSWTS